MTRRWRIAWRFVVECQWKRAAWRVVVEPVERSRKLIVVTAWAEDAT
jgi:hypothetical protein